MPLKYDYIATLKIYNSNRMIYRLLKCYMELESSLYDYLYVALMTFVMHIQKKIFFLNVIFFYQEINSTVYLKNIIICIYFLISIRYVKTMYLNLELACL